MRYLPAEAWVALAAIGVAGVTASLHVLASAMRRACDLHDLRLRMGELRAAYARRLAEEEGEVIEVDPVEPDDVAGRIAPGEPAQVLHAA